MGKITVDIHVLGQISTVDIHVPHVGIVEIQTIWRRVDAEVEHGAAANAIIKSPISHIAGEL